MAPSGGVSAAGSGSAPSCRARLRHVGLSVVSLGRSLAFYRDLLGMQLVGEMQFAGGRYDSILGLENAVGRVAILATPGMELELFEFVAPPPRPADLRRPVCDHGITHFCVEVEDVEVEYRRLSAAGIVFHSAPQSFGGARAVYGRDPDGNVFELLEGDARDTRSGGARRPDRK